MTPELAPETARFFRPKEAHIETAVMIAVFESAQRPVSFQHFEMKYGLASGINPNLLNRPREETIGLP